MATTPEPIDITPEDSIVPIYLIPPTEAEVAELEAIAAQAELDKIAAEEAEATKIAAKESAIAKLAKLGLTAEEASAIVGA
jgi:uncharacterized protein YfaA (DUF2138 family)